MSQNPKAEKHRRDLFVILFPFLLIFFLCRCPCFNVSANSIFLFLRLVKNWDKWGASYAYFTSVWQKAMDIWFCNPWSSRKSCGKSFMQYLSQMLSITYVMWKLLAKYCRKMLKLLVLQGQSGSRKNNHIFPAFLS